MNKLISLVLAGLMILSLSACGNFFGANDNPPMKVPAVADDRPA